MKYYIENSDKEVVAKFDGVEIDIKEGHERHEVDSVEELSEIDVADWDNDYL